MKIKHNHPILTQGTINEDTIQHHGLSYKIIDDDFGFVEVEPERLMAWKKRSKY